METAKSQIVTTDLFLADIPVGQVQTARPNLNRNYEPAGQEGLVIWGKFSTNNAVTDGHKPPRESLKKLNFSDALPEKNAGACVDRQPALLWKLRSPWSIASNGWSIGTVFIGLRCPSVYGVHQSKVQKLPCVGSGQTL